MVEPEITTIINSCAISITEWSQYLLNMTEAPVQKGLSAKLDKKRKRQADDAKQDKPDTAPAAAPAASADGPSKKKRKQKKKQPQEDANAQDRKNGIDESIGRMDGKLLADYFAQRAQKLDKELSAVELNDLSVSGMYSFAIRGLIGKY